jgi:hypothetical protein
MLKDSEGTFHKRSNARLKVSVLLALSSGPARWESWGPASAKICASQGADLPVASCHCRWLQPPTLRGQASQATEFLEAVKHPARTHTWVHFRVLPFVLQPPRLAQNDCSFSSRGFVALNESKDHVGNEVCRRNLGFPGVAGGCVVRPDSCSALAFGLRCYRNVVGIREFRPFVHVHAIDSIISSKSSPPPETDVESFT